MKHGYTHITVILDRTGSMRTIRDDVIGGFNTFLQEQKALPDEATLTLVQFDSQDPYEVLHDFRPIAEVPELTEATYVPRAMTPLLDALGRGINDLAAKIAATPEALRPERTVFVVVTDGHENASREFYRDQIVQMIEDAQTRNGWQFTFLSADLEAIKDAVGYGIPARAALHFEKSADGARAAYRVASHHIGALRMAHAPDIEYTDQDRKQAGAPDRKE